jgi:hypothetical protein
MIQSAGGKETLLQMEKIVSLVVDSFSIENSLTNYFYIIKYHILNIFLFHFIELALPEALRTDSEDIDHILYNFFSRDRVF